MWYLHRHGISLELDTDGACFYAPEHELTNMILDMLYKHREEVKGSSVMDIGTGTGVMALYAKALDAKSVIGIDNNAETRACAKRNGVDAIDNDLCDGIKETFDIIIGNLPMAEQKRCLKMVGQNMTDKSLYFINQKIIEPVDIKGFEIVDSENGIDWNCYVLKKEG